MTRSLKIWFSVAAVLAILSGCAKERPLQERTRILLGTVVTVKAYVDSGEDAYPLIDAALDEMSRIDSICGYLESSEVSRINRNSGHPVSVSEEAVTIIAKSVKYSELSGGALDVTVLPVTRLWNRFEGAEMQVPPRSSVDSALALVDYRGLVLTDSTAMLSAVGGSIDLGALAKGYAVDRGVAVMESLGASGGLIDAGGDIMTFGRKPDGKGWRIGLKDPRTPDSILTVFELEGKAIATSGDYERYFTKDNIRYHHILDPETGFPARRCCSVTVIADLACDADAIATAVFVLGPEKGMDLIETLPGVEALIVVCEDHTGKKILRSSGLGRYSTPG